MVYLYEYPKWKWVITLKLVLANTYLVDFCQQLPVQARSVRGTFIIAVLSSTIVTNYKFNFSSCNSWFSGLCPARVKTLFELQNEICSLDLGRHLHTFRLFSRQRWDYRVLDRVLMCLNVVRLWEYEVFTHILKRKEKQGPFGP